MSGLDFNQFRHLAHGEPLMPGKGYGTREELVYAWKQHEGIILPLWVRTFPATRPFSWWASTGHERAMLPTASRLNCRGAWSDGSRFGVLHCHTIPAVQETERAYLDRHHLLTPAEREAPVADESWALFGSGRCFWREHLASVYGESE